jgi:nitrate/nitrite-specific signal transduction histidine kinase
LGFVPIFDRVLIFSKKTLIIFGPFAFRYKINKSKYKSKYNSKSLQIQISWITKSKSKKSLEIVIEGHGSSNEFIYHFLCFVTSCSHQRVEKLIRVMNCTEDQMVRYATFKLAAEAECWSTAKREHLQQQLGESALIS